MYFFNFLFAFSLPRFAMKGSGEISGRWVVQGHVAADSFFSSRRDTARVGTNLAVIVAQTEPFSHARAPGVFPPGGQLIVLIEDEQWQKLAVTAALQKNKEEKKDRTRRVAEEHENKTWWPRDP